MSGHRDRETDCGGTDIGPVCPHPQLPGTYPNLRAAELASRALSDPQDQRRFLAQVRSALADDIEHGELLQPVRLRERAPPGSVKDRVRLRRELRAEQRTCLRRAPRSASCGASP